VDVITCAIFRDCRLRGVGDLTRRPYNTGHTTVQFEERGHLTGTVQAIVENCLV